MNLIDLAAILPYYITLIFQLSIDDDDIGLCTSPLQLQQTATETPGNGSTEPPSGLDDAERHGVYLACETQTKLLLTVLFVV